MNTVLAPIGRFLLTPWRGRAWRDLWFVLLSSALSLLPLGLIGLPWAVFAPSHLPWVLACAFLPPLAAVLLGPQLTTLRRSAYYEIRGAQIPRAPHTASTDAPFLPRLVARLRHPRTWRQACYHLIAGPAANLAGVIAGTMWAGGLIGFGWLSAAIVLGPNWKMLPLATSLALCGALGCLVVVYLMPWLVMASVRWDLKFATGLLGPSRAERLTRRVTDLTESRAAVVDAADAERRRIERDLHDGAQQRLVSLAMNLGLARATLDLPEDARAALAEAHEEAKAALGELRNLVRGLHPAVLDDRGLDAALSGIAARSPTPVRLAVDVPRRVSPTVEAVAYFMVSEALANVAKHAQASAARVDVRLDGALLRLSVADDGIGGADAARGSGLTGLAQRAASVDGRFRIVSPVGGPTTITVELPCEL
ncbi:sensor histidine kinase [Actinoplanes subtropicus]|uniref:sensor histidine kinase n=1 Tax=Actinoplanes subtropicus TaxID=543632 RepID=UPI000A01A4B7|nr:histidine kinase [Actinoplanes subtropicus]